MRDRQITINYIGGYCPVRAGGTFGGEPFLFRARGQWWSMSIGGNDVVRDPGWYHEEPWGDTEFAAGWMTQHEALGLIAKAFGIYAALPEVEEIKREANE